MAKNLLLGKFFGWCDINNKKVNVLVTKMLHLTSEYDIMRKIFGNR